MKLKKLACILGRLISFKVFKFEMRKSKNCIVNIEHIKNFDISKTGSIIINLDDNTFKIVSKRKIKDVIYFLDERMK